MNTWKEFAAEVPRLAEFGADRLCAAPAYLATIKEGGSPRVHPVTPIVSDMGLHLYMEPTSPKRADLVQRKEYALHNGVADDAGTGGEFWIRGEGRLVEDSGIWLEIAERAGYDPAPRYVLFELLIGAARANTYGDTDVPQPTRWSTSAE